MKLTAKEQSFFLRLLIKVAAGTELLRMDAYIQHGDTSTLWHSIAVAYFSFLLARRLRLHCQWRSLICGALVHDYFLYDWHIPVKGRRFHGFTHPGEALQNARRDWRPDAVQRDIIEKHMFPLTLKPPRFLESGLVCLVDKGCSLGETFGRNRYCRLRELCRDALERRKDKC